ncbi:MAG: glucosyltransferase domain-containing protein [Chromatiales bacterium]|jgi:hypothetical protein|nr:glucosyltransferase domain-containing protein [Chromatiales bacterium]MDX9768246.1 glucosyltransferase domain-containing protein [Ectothiorhodospiraceae bacterium]
MNHTNGPVPIRLDALNRWWLEHRVVVLAVFALNLLAFGYLFFTYIYSNHLFPNALDLGFPSYRTRLEGRWGADIIYRLQGGRGIPLLDLMLAVPIQIANGLLFARLFAIRDPLRLFLAAALISIHPYVSDYYAFAGDHLVLVLGDSFILLAFGLVQWRPRAWWAVAGAAFLFQAALSCYQPKIGLISTLWVLLLLGRLAAWDGTAAAFGRDARELFRHAVAIVAGAALYMLLLKMVQWWMGDPTAVSAHAATRLSTIGLSDLPHQLRWIRDVARQMLFESDFFGRGLAWLPGTLVLAFAATVLLRIWVVAPRGLAAATTIVLLLAVALLPLALYAPFVISREAYPAGRTLTPIVYLIAFAATLLMTPGWLRILRWPALAVALFLCYRYVLIDAETGHLAQLRTTYEFHFVNRLAARVEQVAADAPAPVERYALVAIGLPPTPPIVTPSVRSMRNFSNLSHKAFTWYRSIEGLNFLLGKDLLKHPTQMQVQRGLKNAEGRGVWPAEDSVSVLDDMILIVLEKPGDGVPVTMAAE